VCSSDLITSVVIPNSIVKIGQGVFANTPLSSISIPNSVQNIGAEAFRGTKLRAIEIPNSVTTIEALAFYETILTSIEIPNSVSRIEDQAFGGNLSLKIVSLPDGLSYVAPNAFARSYSLESILYCGSLSVFPINPTCPPERKALLDAKEAADKIEASKVMRKKTTISCRKGKLAKKVTAINPKCPKGFKKV